MRMHEGHQSARGEPSAPRGKGARVFWILPPLLLLPASVGCSLDMAQATARDEAPEVAPAPRVVVCGIDRSGSYDFVPLGVERCGRLMLEARPGDAVLVRWIAEASYTNAEFVTRLALPSVEIPDCSRNPFDNRCRRKTAAVEAAVQAEKWKHAERLREARPARARGTDINGFLQAAADAFQAAPDGAERWLYVATDLEDNVRHSVRPDLTGVHVVVFGFQTSHDPAYTLGLRRVWEKRFRDLGAESVRFEMAEVAP